VVVREANAVVSKVIERPREAIVLLSEANAYLRKTGTLLRKAIARPREAIGFLSEANEVMRKAIRRLREVNAVVRKTIGPPRKAIGHLREVNAVVRKTIGPPRKAIGHLREAFKIFSPFFGRCPSPFHAAEKNYPQCVLQCLQGLVQAAFVCCFDAFKEGTSVEVVKKSLNILS
jgi:hypothetical protein